MNKLALAVMALIVPYALYAAPLRVAANRRYFMDGSGRAIYLTGSHEHSNLVDIGPSNPPARFDWTGYLDFLQNRNHNFIRLWSHQAAQSAYGYRDPLPWLCVQGGPASSQCTRFDLTKFNQSYFDRLRQRVIDAGNRNIYVAVILFQAWDVQNWPGTQGWIYDPFNSNKNINGVNGDLNNDGYGKEIFTLANPSVTGIQDAYVRKVVDTLNDLDNVLYEIVNEAQISSRDWQYHMIDLIHSYEASKAKQHPVGMTAISDQGPSFLQGPYEDLANSPAEWISPGHPNGGDWMNDPPDKGGAKVIITDTDHIWGAGGTVDWVWKSFTRGLNTILMDLQLPVTNASNCCAMPADVDNIRRNMGYTLAYANQLDLNRAVPRSDLCSSGYCLADAGAAYMVYLPGGGSVNVSGLSGNYTVEWLNTGDGAKTSGGTVNRSGTASFTAPFGGAAALFLKSTGAPPAALTCDKVGVDSYEACYYDNSDFTSLLATKNIGANLDFNFALGSPDPLIGPDTFSASYRGSFAFDAGDYELTATADDGVRLYIDGQLIIDKWVDQAATTYKATRAMAAGRHELKLEYYENSGDASLKLAFAKILPYAPTDLDSDGTTNITDVQLGVNQALGSSPCANGDVNHDGACNVVDVQQVVNKALGL